MCFIIYISISTTIFFNQIFAVVYLFPSSIVLFCFNFLFSKVCFLVLRADTYGGLGIYVCTLSVSVCTFTYSYSFSKNGFCARKLYVENCYIGVHIIHVYFVKCIFFHFCCRYMQNVKNKKKLHTKYI